MHEYVEKCHAREHDKMRIKRNVKVQRWDETRGKDKWKCDKMGHDKWSVSEGEKWKEMKLFEVQRLWGGMSIVWYSKATKWIMKETNAMRKDGMQVINGVK